MELTLLIRPVFQHMWGSLGFDQVISREDLQQGVAQLEIGARRVALDAALADARGVRLREAVRNEVEFPHLFRVHNGLADILRMSLPAELRVWAQRALCMPQPDFVDDLRTAVALTASDRNPSREERSLAKFLLFEGVRANLMIAAWQTDTAFEEVGGAQQDLDGIAEVQVDALVGEVERLPPEVRPFNVIVARAMVALRDHAEELKRHLAAASREFLEEFAQRVRIEQFLRDVDLVDDLLIRNRLATHLGEQELSLDELQRRHPVVMGGYSRNSLDQRFSRLR